MTNCSQSWKNLSKREGDFRAQVSKVDRSKRGRGYDVRITNCDKGLQQFDASPIRRGKCKVSRHSRKERPEMGNTSKPFPDGPPTCPSGRASMLALPCTIDRLYCAATSKNCPAGFSVISRPKGKKYSCGHARDLARKGKISLSDSCTIGRSNGLVYIYLSISDFLFAPKRNSTNSLTILLRIDNHDTRPT